VRVARFVRVLLPAHDIVEEVPFGIIQLLTRRSASAEEKEELQKRQQQYQRFVS
jgi:hypothetical protein